LYPDYSVVIPEPLREIGPLAYALPAAQGALLSYVNSWLVYETPNRIPKLFAYWVQGENPPNRNPRWSIQRNVLSWKLSVGLMCQPQAPAGNLDRSNPGATVVTDK